MALELQVNESALTQALTEWVQGRLFTLCVPTGISAITVDHLDTVPGSATVSTTATGGIEVGLTVAVYTVTELDLLVHQNGTVPSGATTPSTTIALTAPIVVVGTELMVGKPTNTVAANTLPEPVAQVIHAKVDEILAPIEGTVLFDCQPIVDGLETYLPADPSVGRGGGVVALRFGALGGTTPHLGAGQEWGVFLDANDAVGLLTRQIPDGFPTKVDVHWQPNGATPSILATTSYDIEVLGVELAGIDATITATLQFVAPTTLRMSAAWTVDLTGVADILEDTAKKIVRGQIRRMLPNVQHDGAQSFHYDFTLPAVPAFLGARPRWASLDSSPAGTTLGGPVQPAPIAPRETLDLRVGAFGRPSYWAKCRALAATGSGKPPSRFESTDVRVRVRGGVTLIDAGALCGAEVLAPNAGLAFTSAEVHGVGFDLTVGQARQISSDVRVVVRTARGVRTVDLGKPRIRSTQDGGLDVQVNYIDDCLYLSGVHLKLAVGETLTIADFEPIPLEDPNWRARLGTELGLDSHLVTIDRLVPRELITVRGAGFRIDVIADADGFARVPGMVAVAENMREVVVERASGLPFEGSMRVRTVAFAWVGEVGPAEQAAVRDIEGTAYLTRIVDGEKVTQVFRPDGIQAFERVGDERAELNPQPLPPVDVPGALRLAEAAGLTEVVGAQFVPGMDDSVALVTRRDGRTVVVSGRQTADVVGEWQGPIPGMIVDGQFAVALSGASLHLFAVTRPSDVRLRASRRV